VGAASQPEQLRTQFLAGFVPFDRKIKLERGVVVGERQHSLAVR